MGTSAYSGFVPVSARVVLDLAVQLVSVRVGIQYCISEEISMPVQWARQSLQCMQ